MRASVYVAQEVGKGLGRSAVLFAQMQRIFLIRLKVLRAELVK